MSKVSQYAVRITKAEWYRLGGFRNSALFRKANKNGVWSYWKGIE